MGDTERQTAVLWEIALVQALAGDLEGAALPFDRVLGLVAAVDATKFLFGPLQKAVAVASLAADRVDAGDLKGLLAWAGTRGSDTVSRAAALFGAAVALLPASRSSPSGGQTSR